MHKSFIEKYRYFIAGFLVAVLLGAFYFTDQFGIQEKISAFSKQAAKEKNYVLKDRCGPTPGADKISHTIPNEEICQISCIARCDAEKLAYRTAIFADKTPACNSCDCECK